MTEFGVDDLDMTFVLFFDEGCLDIAPLVDFVLGLECADSSLLVLTILEELSFLIFNNEASVGLDKFLKFVFCTGAMNFRPSFLSLVCITVSLAHSSLSVVSASGLSVVLNNFDVESSIRSPSFLFCLFDVGTTELDFIVVPFIDGLTWVFEIVFGNPDLVVLFDFAMLFELIL